MSYDEGSNWKSNKQDAGKPLYEKGSKSAPEVNGEVDIVKIVDNAVGIGLALSTMTDEPFTSPKFNAMRKAAINDYIQKLQQSSPPLDTGKIVMRTEEEKLTQSSPPPTAEGESEEQPSLEEKAEMYADTKERRGCSYWAGLRLGYIKGFQAAKSTVKNNS